jgi:hypothetical protein
MINEPFLRDYETPHHLNCETFVDSVPQFERGGVPQYEVSNRLDNF